MSLINDALKRAKQHQPPAAPAGGGEGGGTPMHPVDRRQRSGSGASPLIGILIGMVLLMAGVLFYFAGKFSARTPSSSPGMASQLAATTQTIAQVSGDPGAIPVTTNLAVPDLRPPEIVVTSAPPTIVTQVVIVTSNAPAPVALRLQGILYSPTRPSAMINGKTVFIGERVGDARVLAISQNTVTVVQGGQTNVLALPE